MIKKLFELCGCGRIAFFVTLFRQFLEELADVLKVDEPTFLE